MYHERESEFMIQSNYASRSFNEAYYFISLPYFSSDTNDTACIDTEKSKHCVERKD